MIKFDSLNEMERFMTALERRRTINNYANDRRVEETDVLTCR